MYMYDKYYIQENRNIIDSAKNWNTLLTKQELHIKLKKSVLKKGLKATKELQLLTQETFTVDIFSSVVTIVLVFVFKTLTFIAFFANKFFQPERWLQINAEIYLHFNIYVLLLSFLQGNLNIGFFNKVHLFRLNTFNLALSQLKAWSLSFIFLKPK